MSVLPRLIVTLTAASVIAFAAPAPAVPATAAPSASTVSVVGATADANGTNDPDADLRAAMQAAVDAGATGLSALVDDGDEVSRLAVGSARLDPPLALRNTDQARVGSITKTAIAVIALQLVREGRLALADTIESWLPGTVPGGSSITIRMLLNHTSGIFNYTDDADFFARVLAEPYRHWSPRELIDVATSHPAVFPPGTGWSYSNTGYVLVGLVLQKATGESIGDLVQRRVIRPLDLDNTYFANSARFRGRFAHGYAPPSFTGDGYLDLSRWSPSWAWAAGALVSNPPDLARFYQRLLSGRLLPPALLREMTTTVSPGPGFGYGLGIFTVDTPCGTVWGHDGGIPGYVSIAYNDVAGTRSAVILLPTQPDSAIAARFEEVIFAAVCAMFKQPVPAAAAAFGTSALPSFTREPISVGP
jgi:D-alanyl-D-alanine carboxypeptidase